MGSRQICFAEASPAVPGSRPATHASVERDALLAQGMNPYTNGGNVVSIGIEFESDRARRAHADHDAEGEVVALPPLTSATSTSNAPGERLELST